MLALHVPILVIQQVKAFVVGIERGAEEEQEYAQVTHFLKAAIGGEHSAAHDFETAARDFLTKKIVFGKHRLLMEATKFVKALAVKHHEHTGGKGLVEAGEVLEEVAAPVKNLVGKAALAEDIRRRKVQLFLLHLFHAVAD